MCFLTPLSLNGLAWFTLKSSELPIARKRTSYLIYLREGLLPAKVTRLIIPSKMLRDLIIRG